MVKVTLFPSNLCGEISPPPSKSHTLRALLFALMAHGQSHIYNPLVSPDTEAMLQTIQLLGANIERSENLLSITGTSGKLVSPDSSINCGNSGQILRFIGALVSLFPFSTSFTGDASIQHRRPIFPLTSALNQLGAFTTSSPLTIRGPITGNYATLSGEDSQPVSGLLIAASFAPHPIEFHVTHPGETPWIDLTLFWLRRFEIPVENDSYTTYRLKGNATIAPFTYTVPADFSSASYLIAAALLTQSELTLSSLDFDDPQGDKALISLLQNQGARITSSANRLHIHKSPPLQGGHIDVNPFIDALPLLATLACFSKDPTELYNGAIARKKESDRIHAIAQELTKMGAHLIERPDGLLIYPSKLHGNCYLNAHSDHRIALALSVAALSATGASTLHGIETTAKSYPRFFEHLQILGAKLELAKCFP